MIDWHNLGYTILALRLGRRHLAVRLARWFERSAGARRCASVRVARVRRDFSPSASGSKRVRVLYDRRRRRSRRSIGSSASRSGRRCSCGSASGGSAVGFIVCPTSWTEDEDFDLVIDAVAHLEDRIRGWEAGNATRAVSRSRRARHRRRRAPRGVRAAVCRPAGAARAAADALARARRLPAHRRQRGSRPVPASLLVGRRHSDEGGRSVRRRRPGVRARLRRVPGRARAARRQRPAVLERPSARRSAVRPVRDVSRATRSELDRLRNGARRSAHPTWEEGWIKEAKPVLLPGPGV